MKFNTPVIICDHCGKLIERGQFAYEIQLDDGSIKDSHGGICADRFSDKVKRLPISKPDWWIRQVQNPIDVPRQSIVPVNTVKEEKGDGQ